MNPTTATLLDRLFDYAGAFPPASHSVREATDRYEASVAGPDGWVLGPILLRASQLGEYQGSHPVGVVVDGPLPPAATRIPIVQAERRVGPEVTLGDISPLASIAPVVYLESSDPSDLTVVALAASAREAGLDVRAKLRAGGTSADAFPSVQRVTEFILRCAADAVPFKATAGLHHPLRQASDVPNATEHGFVNLIGAVRCAIGGQPDGVAGCLTETDRAAFDLPTMTWRGEGADVPAEAVRALFRSIGSCSFAEPAAYLHDLGLLPDDEIGQ